MNSKLIICTLAFMFFIGIGIADYTVSSPISDVTITSHNDYDSVFPGDTVTLTCSTSTDYDYNTTTDQNDLDTVTHTWIGPGTFSSQTGTSVTWTVPSTSGQITVAVIANDSPLANDNPKCDDVVFNSQQRIYVDVDATGDDNGTSWADAYTDLQDALYYASSGDEIWVAEGTYYPDLADLGNQDLSFDLVADVKVFGGFDPGSGDDLWSERDWASNQTNLSGWIAGDNTEHIVIGAFGATLDGFTVTGGNFHGSLGWGGAGLAYQVHYIGQQPMEVRNCKFSTNYSNNGGAIWVQGYSGSAIDSDIIIEDCKFEYNYTDYKGGAIFLTSAKAEISNSTFFNNQVKYDGSFYWTEEKGGAIYAELYHSTKITNCVFRSNYAYSASYNRGKGGAIMFNSAHGEDAEVVNCIFDYNYSHYGGAVNVYNTGEDNKVSIINSTFYNNSARGTGCKGAAIYLSGITPVSPTWEMDTTVIKMRNNILWDDITTSGYANTEYSSSGTGEIAITIQYCDVRMASGPCVGTGNFTSDPNFVDESDIDGLDNILGNSDDGLMIVPNSPCIDAGNNSEIGEPNDITGTTRIIDGDSDSTATVDMGAYEYDPNE